MSVLTLKAIEEAVEAGKIGIIPRPDFKKVGASGETSIDLRLGRWFSELRQSRMESIGAVSRKEEVDTAYRKRNERRHAASQLTRENFVAFGEEFVLHPRRFVLGITLEWLALPEDLCGHVTGKSSWGRRGLIIETAAGIHPEFEGCLTLELTNVGEVPIRLMPGLRICQIFFHNVDGPDKSARSQFRGRRKPVLGEIYTDDVVDRLSIDDD